MWHGTRTWHCQAALGRFIGGFIIPNHAYFRLLFTKWSRRWQGWNIHFIVRVWRIRVWRNLKIILLKILLKIIFKFQLKKSTKKLTVWTFWFDPDSVPYPSSCAERPVEPLSDDPLGTIIKTEKVKMNKKLPHTLFQRSRPKPLNNFNGREPKMHEGHTQRKERSIFLVVKAEQPWK